MLSLQNPKISEPKDLDNFNSPGRSTVSFSSSFSLQNSSRSNSSSTDNYPIPTLPYESIPKTFKSLLALFESYKVQVSHLKTILTSMGDRLIAQVNLKNAEVFSNCHNVEKTLLHLIESIKFEPDLINRAYYYLSKSLVDLPSFESKFNQALKSIDEAFSLFPILDNPPVPENLRSDFFVFFPKRAAGYCKIDLDTLQQATVYTESIAYDSGCEISKGVWFLHGGVNRQFQPCKEACLVDLYLDRLQKLPPSNYSRNGSACVKKGQKVYVFGSSDRVSRNCERFDLKELTWAKIAQLPQEVSNVTGSLISKNLTLTALGITGFWEFNKNGLYEFINLNASAGYKALCDHFFLTTETIFELSKTGKSWTAQKFPSNWIAAPLGISLAHRRKGFIYFIDCKQKLYKFSPEEKTLIELIRF